MKKMIIHKKKYEHDMNVQIIISNSIDILS